MRRLRYIAVGMIIELKYRVDAKSNCSSPAVLNPLCRIMIRSSGDVLVLYFALLAEDIFTCRDFRVQYSSNRFHQSLSLIK